MNVALVVLDTLRKDTFDEHFDWLPGRRYERAFATGNWTVPAHASLFCGKYPGELGIHAKHTTLDCPESTLAELLSAEGYRTRAFSANPNVSRPFDFDRGFDEFEGSWRLRGLGNEVFDWDTFISEHQNKGAARYARALVECVTGDCKTIPSLKRGIELKLQDLGLGGDHYDDGAREARSFVKETAFEDHEFLFVNLMEAHAPYSPPESYRSMADEVYEQTTYNGLVATIESGPTLDDDTLRKAYVENVRYLSGAYEKLFDELMSTFDLVITVGDHGECFGEHGAYQHAYGLYPELTHVPLVVSGEGLSGQYDVPVSLIDVHATVLNATGVTGDSRGGSLLDDPEGEVFAEYHGVNRANRGRIKSDGYDPAPFDERLLGVATDGAYAYETQDGVSVDGEGDVGTLKQLLDDHRDRSEWRDVDESREVPDSVRRQLEDLGYA